MVAYISFGHPVWGISFNALRWTVMRSSTFFPLNTWKLQILQLLDSKLIWHKIQRTEIIRYFDIGFSFSVDWCISRCEKLLTSKHNNLNLLTQWQSCERSKERLMSRNLKQKWTQRLFFICIQSDCEKMVGFPKEIEINLEIVFLAGSILL